MNRRLLLLAAVLLIPSCSSRVPDRPPPDEPAALLKCSRESLEDISEQYSILTIPSDSWDRILSVVSPWAQQHGYLPCTAYQMCAVAVEQKGEGLVRVLIRPREDRPGSIAPAADLVISIEDNKIQWADPSVPGCASRAASTEHP